MPLPSLGTPCCHCCVLGVPYRGMCQRVRLLPRLCFTGTEVNLVLVTSAPVLPPPPRW